MSTDAIHIGAVITQGVAFDPKNSQAVRAMDLNELFEAVPRLFDLLDERKIDYALVGDIAMLAYVDGRNTQDIDLIVAEEALAQLPELHIEDRNASFARARFGALQVDLLLTSNQLFEQIRKHHTQVQKFADRAIPCATVEGLLLLKLFALPSLYRQGNFDRVAIYEGDIAALMQRYRPDVSALVTQLQKHLSESDLTEVAAIVSEIAARIEKTRSRFTE